MTQAVIAAKVTKVVMTCHQRNKICWAKKRKERKRQTRPMDCKKSGNMFVLRRTFDEAKLQRRNTEGQTLPAMPCSLSSRQAASQTQARLVNRLCVDRLLVVD